MSSFLVHLLTVAALYAMMGLGLNFQAGYAGLVNFGFVAFVGLGAYAAGIASNAGLPLATGLVAAVAAASALAAAMVRLGRNLSSDYWGIATLALAEILRTVALNENELTGGAQGLGGIRGLFRGWSAVRADDGLLVVVLVCLALCVLASNRLIGGRFGRALKVMREQPALATCFGYDLIRLKTQASVAAAIPASLAGALLTYYISFVGPDVLLASQTFLIWTIVMIGGLGNAFGVLCGALVVQGVYSSEPFLKDALGIGSDLAGAMRLGLTGVLLLACLLWRPRGLLPERVGVSR
ncbi:branched-chain amino acid ABC transporter permease [Burkholderia sp. WAC0059]|uniref:branched-chain amino acid ABC transporter permease n=1 Tax=Burkholderia sp. WAC0059 TaxID=2066022 RepID=UPI000C7EAC73|nr:branched-chain amino acid ABC transporter permease [Burkholderia sp. WAC0059]PLZ00131.1 branched-chain amino acid ABC transporter permease [Burkholderia sp. WAC0059]